MALSKDQIVEYGCRAYIRPRGKWSKNQLQRYIRRQARIDPESAPRRNRDAYKGWYA